MKPDKRQRWLIVEEHLAGRLTRAEAMARAQIDAEAMDRMVEEIQRERDAEDVKYRRVKRYVCPECRQPVIFRPCTLCAAVAAARQAMAGGRRDLSVPDWYGRRRAG